MLWALSEEQKAFKETAGRFSRDRLLPDYQKRENDTGIDRDLLREMGALGLIGPDLPEEFGGLGAASVTAGVIIEETGYGDFNIAYIPLLASLMAGMVARHADRSVAAEWVPKVVAGEAVIGLGLTEPRGGSDAASLTLKAERAGNGYVLNGEKTSMSMSDQVDAIVIFARTGAADAGSRGVSAFFVPMNDPGITKTRFDDVGSKIIGRGSVFFDDVRIPADYLMGEENRGFSQVMEGFDYSRALIGLQCVAAAQASLDEAWAYTKERHAMGRPIAEYQGVTFPLAEAETQIAAARQLCYHTLSLRDVDMAHTAEAAMCKWFAPKTAFDAIHQCLLTFGHYGWTKDLPHQQRLRDVMGLEIGDGTAQIMKLIIAREKVGSVAVQYHRAKS